jgi:hypothetical protein
VLGRADVDFLRRLARERSTIVLEPGKEYLVESRLVPVLRERQFDVVMLRNVLIYFDAETKRGMLCQVQQSLRPEGFLLLGSAETTMRVDDSGERVSCGPIAYRPPATPAARTTVLSA